MSKHEDNHANGYTSADEMISVAARPRGEFSVSACDVEVKEDFKFSIGSVLIGFLGAAILLAVGIDLDDVSLLLLIVLGIPLAIRAWLKGIRSRPSAVVLHGGTISILEDVLFNKATRKFAYKAVHHIPKSSIEKQFHWTLSPSVKFKSKQERVTVTLTSTRKTRKQNPYGKNVIDFRDMKRQLLS